ncbi:MAG: RidA family protein [Acidimicrobiales bacterium]
MTLSARGLPATRPVGRHDKERDMQLDFIRLDDVAAPGGYGPHCSRVGDYLFVASIDPGLGWGDGSSGRAAVAVEAQTRSCMETLKAVLSGAGSSLADVVKVNVHLADAGDFYEFQLVWKECFAQDPPARTVIVVGDTLPGAGQRLNLDAVALRSGGQTRRETLASAGVPSPGEAEWAPYAVKAGPLVFCSGFPATDFTSGLAVAKHPAFPNYGNDAEMQADYILGNLNKVLAEAGTSVADTLEAQLYEPDLSTFHDIDRVWAQYMPVPPARSSMGVVDLLVPGAKMVADLIVLVPDAEHAKGVSEEGLRWHPTQSRGVNFSPTVTAGPWRFLAGQIATPDFGTYVGAPAGVPNYFSDIEIQADFILQMLSNQLDANQSDLAHCFHARVYLMHPRRDQAGFERVWRRYFPDPDRAPALALVPTTGIMFPGPIIEIDLTAVAS